MTGLNTLERDDLLRRIAWLNAEVDKIKRMLKGEQVGTARIADAAITNAKIKDLTWDKARGGTATLGGLNNTDGILSVKDASNVEKVVLDKDGILINDGKIVIKNGNEESIVDESGIVSTNVFPVDEISGFPYTTFSNSSYSTISGTETISFSLSRDTRALILVSIIAASAQISSGDCTGRNLYRVYSDLDGGLTDFMYDSFLISSTNVRENIISKTYSKSDIVTLSAGDHNINLQSMIDFNTNMNTTLDAYNLSIILLGS